MVIVSCETLGTPSVLERSGLGDSGILEAAGVPVIKDLPGAGHDFQDHNLTYHPYKADLSPGETFDGLSTGNPPLETLLEKVVKIIGWNGFDASSKIRPRESEIDELGPEFRRAWDKDYAPE